MSRLTRDGTAEPVSRDQILRHARGQGNIIFPVQLTTSRIGNLTRFSERAARGGGGGAASLFFLFLFPCSADHERDWPPCKVVFFRVGNQCAEYEKQQQQKIFVGVGFIYLFIFGGGDCAW